MKFDEALNGTEKKLEKALHAFATAKWLPLQPVVLAPV